MSTQLKDPGFREQVLDWCRGLNDKQFAEFFYEAVASRNTSDLPEWRGHFVLADAEFVDDGPWEVDFIALPVETERAPWSDEGPICQSGTCGSCGFAVRSWSKRAECPVCANPVYCT